MPRENPRLSFWDLQADLELARACCQPCPIRWIYLAGAVERHEPYGVWGGEIFDRGAVTIEKKAARPTAQKSRGRRREKIPSTSARSGDAGPVSPSS